MSDSAIRADKLSKQYTIGVAQQPYNTLRDQLIGGLKRFLCQHNKPTEKGTLWVLHDVSFEVKHGEVLGIIGRNGAGKSTLLKILSRITEPTEGIATIYGRVASLLEVGTGFHPELTGRENIYLNGAVLGMSRAEINRKFDEIVTFSGIEKFIDTPIKRYSSGMKVRLAFSVAAHLEPEILIIDEVLAVGDLAFQNRCLGKMEEVAHGGRTILFVSHNMGAIMNLCTSCIWLDEGRVAANGDVEATTRAYVEASSKESNDGNIKWNRSGTGEARIVDIDLLDRHNNLRTTFKMGEDLIVEFDIEFYEFFSSVELSFEIKRKNLGINIVHITNQDCGLLIENVNPGKHRYRIDISHVMLYPSIYSITLCIWNPGSTIDYVKDVLDFSIIQSDITQRTSELSMHTEAIFYMPSKWAILY